MLCWHKTTSEKKDKRFEVKRIHTFLFLCGKWIIPTSKALLNYYASNKDCTHFYLDRINGSYIPDSPGHLYESQDPVDHGPKSLGQNDLMDSRIENECERNIRA